MKFIKKEIYSIHDENFKKKLYAKYVSPSTNSVYLICLMLYHEFAAKQKHLRLLKTWHKTAALIYKIKLARRYGIYIGKGASIGAGLRLPHPIGIVIGEAVTIGDNCTIYQQVTIGSSNIGDSRLGKQPRIGDNVVIFSGAKVLGDITIENDVVIGANSVVNNDLPSGGVYAGVPAKLIQSIFEKAKIND